MTESKITENKYDNLDKNELIALVKHLNEQLSARLSDKAAAAAVTRLFSRLSLAAAIILIPARYRILLLSRPVSPIFKDYTDFLLFASDIAVLSTIFFWLLYLVLEPDRQSVKLKTGPIFLTFPLSGIVFISGVSTVFSIDPALSTYHTLRLAGLLLLYLYAIQDSSLLRWIFLPAGISITIQSFVAIVQVLRQSSLGFIAFGELVLNPDWSGVSIVWADGIRSLRAYGLSDHPNILGGCLAFGLLMCVLWYLTVIRKSPHHWALAGIAGLIFLGGSALFFTFSRSAWLAFSAGLIVMFILLVVSGMHVSWRSMLGLMVGSLVVSTPFLIQNASYLGSRLNYQGSFNAVGNEFRAINERRLLNASANEIFARHALTGVGLGAYPQMLLIEQPDFPIDYQPAHNVLVAAAADIGLFGAFACAIALAAPWLALGTAWWKGKLDVLNLHLIGLSGLLAALTVVGMFDYYTWLLAPGRLWMWLAWGLWGAVYQSSMQGRSLA